MTQSKPMRLAALAIGWAALILPLLSWAQTADDIQIYPAEAPRLLLRPQRLRLLTRERDRQSPRWGQLDLLVRGGARLPEEGFAYALYYQVAKSEAAGRRAVAWALSGSDLRQLALVFDWCQPLLTASESQTLQAKLRQGISASERANDVPTVAARTLAALALADAQPKLAEDVVRNTIQRWWRDRTAQSLRVGRLQLARGDIYPLFELLHVIRDNTQTDLRESAPKTFQQLPGLLLLSYYPSPYPAPENVYRIPFFVTDGDPDLRAASLARAAELSLVAYDNNALESQFLQGWLNQDPFALQSAFGAAYEFLWANPYQPGLTYQKLPLQAHDAAGGRLYLRSSWDEDATWLGIENGQIQLFREGKRQSVRAASLTKPIEIGESAVVAGRLPARLALQEQSPRLWYLVGLQPNHLYQIEVDDEEVFERASDGGGILEVPLRPRANLGVRIHEPLLRAGSRPGRS